MDFLCDYESNNSLFILRPILVLIYVLFCFLPSVSDFLKNTKKKSSRELTRKFSIRLTNQIIIKVRVQNTPARA